MQQVFPGKQGDETTKVPLPVDLIDGLIETLSHQLATVQALMAEAERKQDALLEDDVALLEEVVASEVSLLQELEQWETQRLSQVTKLEQQLDGSGILVKAGTGLSLEQITHRFPDSRGQLLLQQGEELRGSILRLQELNLLNADLLRHSLTLTNYCLSLMTGDTGQTIYGEPGKKERQGYQPGRLDARA